MLTTLNNYNCNYYFIMHLDDIKKFLVSRTHNTGISKTEKLRMYVYDLQKLKYPFL